MEEKNQTYAILGLVAIVAVVGLFLIAMAPARSAPITDTSNSGSAMNLAGSAKAQTMSVSKNDQAKDTTENTRDTSETITLRSGEIYRATFYYNGVQFLMKFTPSAQEMRIVPSTGGSDTVTVISQSNGVYTASYYYDGHAFALVIDLPAGTVTINGNEEYVLRGITTYFGTIYYSGAAYEVEIYPSESEMELIYQNGLFETITMLNNIAYWAYDGQQWRLEFSQVSELLVTH